MVISPNDPFGFPGSGPADGKATYIAKLPFEVRIPDPNKQALIRHYLNPKLKSIYDIIGPGMLPWEDGYDFSGWSEDTMFTIIANCDIPAAENTVMIMNFLDYKAMKRSNAKAKNFKKQPYILNVENLTEGKQILPASEPQIIDPMGSNDKSWEIPGM